MTELNTSEESVLFHFESKGSIHLKLFGERHTMPKIAFTGGVIKSSVKSDITAGNEKLPQKVVINSRSKIDSKSNYQRR